MSFTITWEKDGVVRTFSGTVDIEEVLEADRCFYNDPRSDEAKFQITDFTQGEPGVIDESLVEDIAILDFGSTYSIPSLKVGFITKDPYVKALCQKYIEISQEAQSTWEFMIFDNMESARNWATTK